MALGPLAQDVPSVFDTCGHWLCRWADTASALLDSGTGVTEQMALSLPSTQQLCTGPHLTESLRVSCQY